MISDLTMNSYFAKAFDLYPLHCKVAILNCNHSWRFGDQGMKFKNLGENADEYSNTTSKNQGIALDMEQVARVMKNNRRHDRTPVILKVDYRDVDKFFTNFAENLSEGGMFISTNRPLNPGTTLFLEFLLPNSSLRIKTRAEVMWSRTDPKSPKEKRGMGVRFEDLSQEDKAKINHMIERMKKGLQ